MKTKHIIRLVSVVAGVSLVGCGLVDGYNNILPHLDAQWLLGSGIVLIVVSARKLPKSLSGS